MCKLLPNIWCNLYDNSVNLTCVYLLLYSTCHSKYIIVSSAVYKYTILPLALFHLSLKVYHCVQCCANTLFYLLLYSTCHSKYIIVSSAVYKYTILPPALFHLSLKVYHCVQCCVQIHYFTSCSIPPVTQSISLCPVLCTNTLFLLHYFWSSELYTCQPFPITVIPKTCTTSYCCSNNVSYIGLAQPIIYQSEDEMNLI